MVAELTYRCPLRCPYCSNPVALREFPEQLSAADWGRVFREAAALGLECHAGHGLSFDTVQPIAAIPELIELNIGHFLVGEAIFIGLEQAVAEMRRLMDEARGAPA